MEQLSENGISLLKTAHGRLYNQFNNLLSDYNKHIESDSKEKISLTLRINELEKKLQELIDNKKPTNFVIGQKYYETIEEVLGKGERMSYDSADYFIYEITLKNRDEVYEAYINSKYQVTVNSKIRFTFSENNILRKTKVY